MMDPQKNEEKHLFNTQLARRIQRLDFVRREFENRKGTDPRIIEAIDNVIKKLRGQTKR